MPGFFMRRVVLKLAVIEQHVERVDGRMHDTFHHHPPGKPEHF
jgi:hypothetical protein